MIRSIKDNGILRAIALAGVLLLATSAMAEDSILQSLLENHANRCETKFDNNRCHSPLGLKDTEAKTLLAIISELVGADQKRLASREDLLLLEFANLQAFLEKRGLQSAKDSSGFSVRFNLAKLPLPTNPRSTEVDGAGGSSPAKIRYQAEFQFRQAYAKAPADRCKPSPVAVLKGSVLFSCEKAGKNCEIEFANLDIAGIDWVEAMCPSSEGGGQPRTLSPGGRPRSSPPGRGSQSSSGN